MSCSYGMYNMLAVLKQRLCGYDDANVALCKDSKGTDVALCKDSKGTDVALCKDLRKGDYLFQLFGLVFGKLK